MRRLPVVLVLLAVFAMCGCSGGRGSSGPVLTVAIPPQKYLLEQIVGDTYRVNSLMSSSSDPETFEPSLSQLVDLQHSDAYFTLGTLPGEEASLPRIRSNFPELKIVDTSAGVHKLYGTHECHIHGHHHDGEEEAAENADPHVWTSIPNARAMAEVMYAEVVRLNPVRRDLYARNYARLMDRLSAAEDSIRESLSGAGERAFAVWHPSLSYFAAEYGLEQLSFEGEGREMTPKQYRRKLDEVREHAPELFLLEKEKDPKQALSAAEMLGVPTLEVSVMQEDFIDQLKRIADAVARK